MDKYELLNYMPDYYKGVYEMEELLKAQGTAVSHWDSDIELTLERNFIKKADVKGISIFENELGIKPNPGDSLETRRNNVLLHALPPQPLTAIYINHLFNIMGLKVKVSVDHANRVAIVNAQSDDITFEKIKNVRYLLNVTLPVTMIYQINISLHSAQTQREVYFGTVTTSDTHAAVYPNKGQLNF